MSNTKAELTPKLLQILGERVRLARTLLVSGSRKDIDFSSINYDYLGYIERGQRNLSLDLLFRLCADLNLTMSELLEGIEDDVKVNSEIKTNNLIVVSPTFQQKLLNKLADRNKDIQNN